MDSINLISWNVNGIRAVAKKGFFDWFRQTGPDILCIQETRAQEEQLASSLRYIEGYKAFFSNPERKGYSGVALYTKIPPLDVRYDIGVEEFDREGRTILAEFEDFMLLDIYFPNGNASKERLDYKMDFYDRILNMVDDFVAEGKNVIICGDVNTAHREIDLARPKQNEKRSGFLPQERAWIDTLLDHGFIDTFRLFNSQEDHYTWWDLKTRARERNVGWRIDYFFANQGMKENIEAAYILPDVMGSDHCPVGLTVSFDQ